MLSKLEIKNYAIIDHVEIDFDKGLNIITGETGAGKSILLGALGLTLGNRVDSKVLYNQDSKCVIEATIELDDNFQGFFEENELDFEKTSHIRREISTSGKSRAFINDTPVNLAILKSLTEQVINLHSQHETLTLNEQGFQLSVVDFVAKNEKIRAMYHATYSDWKAKVKQLAEWQNQQLTASNDMEFHAFQLKEIVEAALEDEVMEDMENELATLSNAETIKNHLYTAANLLENEQISALQMLNEAQYNLRDLSSFGEKYEGLFNRIDSSIVEIADLKNEIENIAESTEYDEERIAYLTEKVNIGNKLLQKHQVATIEELMQIKDDLEEKTFSLDHLKDKIAQLEKDIFSLEKKLNTQAEELAKTRSKAIPQVEKNIKTTLQKIGMPNASFVVAQKEMNELKPQGKDELTFLFTANKGFEPQPIQQIASGGELSRVMLAIKSLLADFTSLPTLIFDEIDTGISGEIAAKVGEVFQSISENHQLISITHLPQIAAKADRHFFIYKAEKDEKTQTKIAALNTEQHTKAIARMLSGENITEASLDNARQLIG